MTQECLFVAEADGLAPTERAVGPWSTDTLQGSAYGGLLVRALERSDPPAGMEIARAVLPTSGARSPAST